MSVWNRRKEILYGNGSIGEVGQQPHSRVRGQWHWVL